MFERQLELGARTSATGLGELVSRRIAPSSDWTDMGGSEHFVQFYDSDEFIINSVSEYIIHGLKMGQTCIVAATRPHLDEIEVLIEEFGSPVERAKADGRYIPLDAKQTLDLFMADDRPDPDLFASVIGSLIRDAAARSGSIRVYGEMVGVLAAGGNYEAAIKLEDMWNKLRRVHPFSLFCGYPMSAMKNAAAGERMTHICDSHTRVIPDESYTGLTSADERLRMIAMLQQKGKQLEAELATLEHRIAKRQSPSQATA